MGKPRRRVRKKKKKTNVGTKKKNVKENVNVDEPKTKKVVEMAKPQPKFKRNEEVIARLKRNANRMKKGGQKMRKARFGSKKKGQNKGQIEAKLNIAMKQLQGQDIQDIDEVNIFKKNGKVIHFEQPKVTAAMNSNTYLINGERQRKNINQLKDVADQLPSNLRQKYLRNKKEVSLNDGNEEEEENVEEKKEKKEEVEKKEEKEEDDDELPEVEDFNN